MEKYGTPQKLIEEDGFVKVSSQKTEKCCLKKLSEVMKTLERSMDLECECGNRLAIEKS
jgi:hypothetical protein